MEDVGPTAAYKPKVGDRVCGFSHNNGFEDYLILNQTLADSFLDLLFFGDASLFPLCITTSSFALFERLPRFAFPALIPPGTDKPVLIWGGSPGVGSNAIQLGKVAGFEVVTTCSPSNSDYVKSLSADKVFNDNSPFVTDNVAAELDKDTCASIYMAAGKVAEPCQS